MKALSDLAARAYKSLLENIHIKLLSLVLSIALFSIVHSDQDAQRAIFVDVVALLPPEDSNQMLLTELPHEVKVTLRGSRSRINAIDRNDFHPIQMDLTDPGKRFFYFDPASVDTGGNIQVVEISPSTISLQWARRTERRLPVLPRFDGKLLAGLSLGPTTEVVPQTVTVRGPVDLVAGLKTLHTDLISLNGFTLGDQDVRAPLAVLPQHVSYEGDPTVRVRFSVVEEQGEVSLRRLTVAVLGGEAKQVRPAFVTVKLTGPVRRLDELVAEDVVPYVELPEDPPRGAFPLDVAVRGDLQDLTVVSVSPPSVLVRAAASSAAQTKTPDGP